MQKNAAAKQRVTSINFYSHNQKKDPSSSVIIENNNTVNSVHSLTQNSHTEPTSKQALNVYNQTIYAHAASLNQNSQNSFEVQGRGANHQKSPSRGNVRTAGKKSPLTGKNAPLNFYNHN